jgi:hypothetical protein
MPHFFNALTSNTTSFDPNHMDISVATGCDNNSINNSMLDDTLQKVLRWPNEIVRLMRQYLPPDMEYVFSDDRYIYESRTLLHCPSKWEVRISSDIGTSIFVIGMTRMQTDHELNGLIYTSFAWMFGSDTKLKNCFQRCNTCCKPPTVGDVFICELVNLRLETSQILVKNHLEIRRGKCKECVIALEIQNIDTMVSYIYTWGDLIVQRLPSAEIAVRTLAW